MGASRDSPKPGVKTSKPQPAPPEHQHADPGARVHSPSEPCPQPYPAPGTPPPAMPDGTPWP